MVVLVGHANIYLVEEQESNASVDIEVLGCLSSIHKCSPS